MAWFYLPLFSIRCWRCTHGKPRFQKTCWESAAQNWRRWRASVTCGPSPTSALCWHPTWWVRVHHNDVKEASWRLKSSATRLFILQANDKYCIYITKNTLHFKKQIHRSRLAVFCCVQISVDFSRSRWITTLTKRNHPDRIDNITTKTENKKII